MMNALFGPTLMTKALALSTGIALMTVAGMPDAVAQEGELVVNDDGGLPSVELYLLPQTSANDDRAFTSFFLPGVVGAEDSAGAQSLLAARGVFISLHCPNATGGAGVEIPFDTNMACDVDMGGIWQVTHDRVVVISGLLAPGAPESEAIDFEWTMHRLIDAPPQQDALCEIDPRLCYAVKDVGMTEHVVPKFTPPGPI